MILESTEREVSTPARVSSVRRWASPSSPGHRWRRRNANLVAAEQAGGQRRARPSIRGECPRLQSEKSVTGAESTGTGGESTRQRGASHEHRREGPGVRVKVADRRGEAPHRLEQLADNAVHHACRQVQRRDGDWLGSASIRQMPYADVQVPGGDVRRGDRRRIHAGLVCVAASGRRMPAMGGAMASVPPATEAIVVRWRGSRLPKRGTPILIRRSAVRGSVADDSGRDRGRDAMTRVADPPRLAIRRRVDPLRCRLRGAFGHTRGWSRGGRLRPTGLLRSSAEASASSAEASGDGVGAQPARRRKVRVAVEDLTVPSGVLTLTAARTCDPCDAH